MSTQTTVKVRKFFMITVPELNLDFRCNCLKFVLKIVQNNNSGINNNIYKIYTVLYIVIVRSTANALLSLKSCQNFNFTIGSTTSLLVNINTLAHL